MEKKLPSKKTSQHKFPSISRSFTEGKLLLFITLLLLEVGIVVLGYQLYTLILKRNTMELERLKVTQDISFWNSVIEQYPNYRDAYYQIAIREYQLGDLKKSKEYNDKALVLDPNFEEGRKLEKILGN